MFPIWIILGIVMIFLGVFNRQMLQLLGFKPLSEIFTVPSLKRSSLLMEKIGHGLVITLGSAFLVHGLGEALPNDISYKISFVLLGLAGLMVLAMIGITMITWNVK